MDWLKPQDLGETLNFRTPHDGGTAVVLVTREALEDDFGMQEGQTMLQVFQNHQQDIVDRVAKKLVQGTKYTVEAPFVVSSGSL